MTNWIFKIVIMIILFVVRKLLLPNFAGPLGGFIIIGEQTVTTNLVQDGNTLIMSIFSFIVTLLVYYIIAEILTFALQLIFKQKS